MPQDAPLVAIITPVYNGADYLAETMDCVQAQTYPNLVHVVLDNASTDATPEIISRYTNGRVPVITARNTETVTLNDNWDRAVKMAPREAQWVRVLCADDKIMPEYVAKTMAIAAANPNVVVIATGVQLQDEVRVSNWEPGVSVMSGREAARRIFMDEGEIVGSHLMLRADAVNKRDPHYNTNYLWADTELGFFVMQYGDWAGTTEILAWTRIHEGSVTHKTMHVWNNHFIDWLRYIHDYGRWAMNPEQFAAHRRAFLRYYLRRMLRWRMKPGSGPMVERHFKLIGELDTPPTPFDFADAVADLALKRVGLRTPVRGGFPLG
ncbi:MAG: glycosyltransferase family 2 protein [Alphaproteobacteria bacterium]